MMSQPSEIWQCVASDVSELRAAINQKAVMFRVLICPWRTSALRRRVDLQMCTSALQERVAFSFRTLLP
jgi:hypothetical protein